MPEQKQEGIRMLEIKEIWKTFNAGTVNEKQALRGVSLTLKDGDFCTVIGGNGAGKSTMLNAVAGTFSVDSGAIVIGGVDVTRLPEHKRAKFIGRVFQDPMMGTAPTMQIEENLALAARRGQPRGLGWGITKTERADYRELLRDLGLGLEDRLTSKVGLLSGGQRQALTLLMASLKRPKLLLLDEVAAGLTPAELPDFIELVRRIRDSGVTIICIEHLMRFITGICDRVAVLEFGTKIAEGVPQEVLSNEDVISAYLGKTDVH